MLGNGDGSFQAPIFSAVGDGPASVADLNGDTRPDLVTANRHSGDVTVLLNLSDPSALEVGIEIKPDSDVNILNPISKGVIPAAILGSEFLDVTDIDRSTLAFGPNGAQPVHRTGGHLDDVADSWVCPAGPTGVAPTRGEYASIGIGLSVLPDALKMLLKFSIRIARVALGLDAFGDVNRSAE